MVPLPGPATAAPPRLLLLPAAAAGSPPPGQGPLPASPSPPPRKRQRLAHLSPEEKALRRKLKNRVAAQSARDRKKARLGELERQAVELEAQNQKLQVENEALRQRTRSLARENRQLRLRLGLPILDGEGGNETGPAQEQVEAPPPPPRDAEEQEKPTSRLVGAATGSAESAALRLRVPPQQGQAQQSPASPGPVPPSASAWMTQMALTLRTLRSASESDLLLGILDCLDPELFLHCSVPEEPCLGNHLQQGACAREVGSLPASPGSALGPSSPKLETINELIRFDHEYTKPFFLEIMAEGDSQPSMLLRIEGASESSPVTVKEEPVEAAALPELGVPHLLPPYCQPPPMPCTLLLDASSDSGYEGSPSPFSDLSSPLDAQDGWEEAFANELFPQLISV